MGDESFGPRKQAVMFLAIAVYELEITYEQAKDILTAVDRFSFKPDRSGLDEIASIVDKLTEEVRHSVSAKTISKRSLPRSR